MYAREVSGQELTFEVIGVWRRNMLIRDRETGTIWQQATGEALAGPLKGATLPLLGGTLTTWSDWKTEHPQTELGIETKWEGTIPRERLIKMLQISHVMKAPGLSIDDRRLPSHEEIVGLVISGESRAYPLSALRQRGKIEDRLGGALITITYDPKKDRVHAYTGQEPLFPDRQWWLGWSEFHPGCSIWQEGHDSARV